MLILNNLTIEYDKKMLDDVHMEFRRGEITVIRGASGSGKSSILNVLGLMQSSACEYLLDGTNIGTLSEDQKAEFRLKNIGFVFQQNNLLEEFTTIENVQIPMILDGNPDYEFEAESLIDFVGLTDFRKKYPKVLSGGEEQRVSIARAMANKAEIILADEPTAALDGVNRQNILELFAKLANESHKIVIIVSHDDMVCAVADTVYEIENKKIHCVNKKELGTEICEDIQPEKDSVCSVEGNNRKNVKKFLSYYNKTKKADRLLNKGFVFITSVIAAIAILFLNFGDNFTKKQEHFVNAISDRSLFVVNDVIGINAKTDYSGALAITEEEFHSIESVPSIHKVYPYFEFSSSGETGVKWDFGKTEITVKDNNKNVIKSVKYENASNTSSGNNSFAVVPMYPEENLNYLSLYDREGDSFDTGAVLTYTMASLLSDKPEELIGKEITINCMVPTKLYDTKATRDVKQNEDNGQKSKYEIKIDAAYHKNIEITRIITGVLSDNYQALRTEGIDDCILLSYDQMESILQDNLDHDFTNSKPDFPQKEFRASAVTVFVNDYNSVQNVKDKIETISTTFNVNSSALDVSQIKDNISFIKTVMTIVSVVFITIAIIMFSALYYLKNRSRKKEVGILKAIGLTQNNVRNLFLHEMRSIALKSFIISLVLSVIFTILANSIMMSELFTITIGSIILGFVLSVVIVLVSGVIPVLKASKIDPINAIRQMNK